MYCVCEDCFADIELKGFIASQRLTGKCDCCSKDNVNVIDIDELLDFFSELFSNLELSAGGIPLADMFSVQWRLFSNRISAIMVIDQVLPKIDTIFSNSLQNTVFIPEIMDNVNYWNELKEEIKWKKRYTSNINKLIDLGWDSFFESKMKIQPSDIFYRARLHSASQVSPFSENEMYAPCRENASAGRANPLGIPFLYLSNNRETILYEIRATYLDELSVGQFRLSDGFDDGVLISDFTEEVNLYGDTGSINSKIKTTLLRNLISEDLSRPMRRYDSEIDYIPTQFICEFIMNFTNVKGVKFRSSLYPSGNNIVIFDQKIMKCIDVTSCKVSKVLIEV